MTCPRCDGSGYEPVQSGPDLACLKCGGAGISASDDRYPDEAEYWHAPFPPATTSPD
ncbi:DnaJ-class molecular chaperone [Azospirillum rugosum]|uniref:DnaJ-class molecular chaperone n=1 Tax=Azospirillum rugosum TaxID=416170 RepID=A0ABS4SED9_9PROT|nr:DnaJ-class molecular chaperone [Azospirillum rugosum]MDQ0525654.1 DnaJ-class molecular chaperone [Azospirillum rugosum]